MKKKFYISTNVMKSILFGVLDSIIIFLTYVVAFIVDTNQFDILALFFTLGVLAVQVIIFVIFGVYHTITDRFSIGDSLRFAVLITLGTLLAYLADRFISAIPHLQALIFVFIDALEVLLIIGIRLTRRLFTFYRRGSKDSSRTMIIGAGAAAKIAFDELHNNVLFDNNVICFIDNDPDKIGRKYLTKPVYGPTEKAPEIIKKYNIKEVIIAISNLSNEDLQHIISILSPENVVIKRLPILSEMDIKKKIYLFKKYHLLNYWVENK